MNKNIEKQLEYFKQYGITDYEIKGDTILVKQNIYLNKYSEFPDDLFQGCVICGFVSLNGLKEVKNPDFLKGVVIVSLLGVHSLQKFHPDFLKQTQIGEGVLYCVKFFDKLQRTYLDSREKPLSFDYYPDKGFCYFDGIFKIVDKVTQKEEYTIYHTRDWDDCKGFVIQKGQYTAHADTIRKGIADVHFKIARKHYIYNPISMEDYVTRMDYRLITGACRDGIKDWMDRNGIKAKRMKVKNLLPLLEGTNAYGVSKFKQLIK